MCCVYICVVYIYIYIYIYTHTQRTLLAHVRLKNIVDQWICGLSSECKRCSVIQDPTCMHPMAMMRGLRERGGREKGKKGEAFGWYTKSPPFLFQTTCLLFLPSFLPSSLLFPKPASPSSHSSSSFILPFLLSHFLPCHSLPTSLVQ